MTTLTETNLRVLIADENEEALRGLHEVLSRLGHEVTPYAIAIGGIASNELARLCGILRPRTDSGTRHETRPAVPPRTTT